MRALVIGADGFAGRWLLRHLVESGDSVVAVVGPKFEPPLEGAARIEQVDVRTADALAATIGDARPDVVFDLAGVSRREDREDVEAAVGVSVIGGLNAMLGCGHVVPPPRLLFVSTAYVYEAARSPLTERSAVKPNSIYASAKLAAERVLTALAPAVGIEVVIARPFNHIGPGQAASFVVPTLARQLAGVLNRSGAPTLRVADSSIVRDYSDVRDVVRAYRLIAERGMPGDIYNIASGVGVTVADVGRMMASTAGVEVSVVSDNGAVHDEVSTLIGDAAKLQSLGWGREHQLVETLADILDEALSEAVSTGGPGHREV